MEMLDELMAPIEDAAEGEDEITTRDEGSKTQSPSRSPETPNYFPKTTSNAIAARTFHSGAGAGGASWAVAGVTPTQPQQARLFP